MTSLVLNVDLKDKIKTLQKNLLRKLNKNFFNIAASDSQSWKIDLFHTTSNAKFHFRMLQC